MDFEKTEDAAEKASEFINEQMSPERMTLEEADDYLSIVISDALISQALIRADIARKG